MEQSSSKALLIKNARQLLTMEGGLTSDIGLVEHGSEDSSIFGKSLIFAGLAEGVCLYGLIISFMILGKL